MQARVAENQSGPSPNDGVAERVQGWETRSTCENGIGSDQWAILAGIRFFLALTVLVCHLSHLVQNCFPFKLFEAIGAETAVLCFFLISGFSIAHSIKTQSAGFLGRRIDRIYPAYVIGLALSGLLIFASRAHALPPNPLDILGQFFFLQGFATSTIAGQTPSWSLSCEMFYYLLAPVFAKLRTDALLLIVTASAACYIFRGNICAGNLVGQPHGIPAICLLWLWLLGFLCYELRTTKWFTALLLTAGPSLTLMYGYPMPQFSAAAFVGTCVALIFSPDFTIAARWRKVLNELGDVSYTMYICHLPLILLGLRVTQTAHFLPLFASVMAIIFGLHFGIEKPLRQWLRRRVKTVGVMPAAQRA